MAGVGSKKGRTKLLLAFFFFVFFMSFSSPTPPPLLLFSSSPSFSASSLSASSSASSSSLIFIPVGLQATTPLILKLPPTARDSAPSGLRTSPSSAECSSASQVEPRVEASETSRAGGGGEEEGIAAVVVPPPAPPFRIPESLTQIVSAPRVAERGTGLETTDSSRVERAVQRSCGVGSPSGGC